MLTHVCVVVGSVVVDNCGRRSVPKMDFLVKFPPHLVQHLENIGKNCSCSTTCQETLHVVYQDLTRVVELEEKPPRLPVTSETAVQVVSRLIGLIKECQDGKSLTQAYYVLSVLIDEDFNNETAVTALFEWFERPPPSCSNSISELLPLISTGVLHFVENVDEHWLSEYCLRFLAVFMRNSSERQLLIGTSPGVVGAIISVLSDPQSILLTNLLEFTFSVISSLLGRNMLYSTRIGTEFIQLRGFHVLNEIVTDIATQVRSTFKSNNNKLSRNEIDLLISALDSLRCYFAWVTQHYEYASETFDRSQYCYEKEELPKTSIMLSNTFDMVMSKSDKKNVIFDVMSVAEALLKVSICFGDMIRNNYEPEGAMMELALLHVVQTEKDSDDSLKAGDITEEEEGSTQNELASPTLLEKILILVCGGSGAPESPMPSSAVPITPSLLSFLMESVLEWGDESSRIAKITSDIYFAQREH